SAFAAGTGRPPRRPPTIRSASPPSPAARAAVEATFLNCTNACAPSPSSPARAAAPASKAAAKGAQRQGPAASGAAGGGGTNRPRKVRETWRGMNPPKQWAAEVVPQRREGAGPGPAGEPRSGLGMESGLSLLYPGLLTEFDVSRRIEQRRRLDRP